MPPKKTIPTAFAVVDIPKATKLAAAEGKVALMRRVHQLSNDGEKILAFLFRVMDGDGNVTQGLEAAKMLLAYGYGKPIEVTVTADATPQPQGGVSSLTSAQLEAVVTGTLTAPTVERDPTLGGQLPSEYASLEDAEASSPLQDEE